MSLPTTETAQIAVIGLGYVGLPLALALSRHFPTLGFDIDKGRIAELRRGVDRTGEVDPAVLRAGLLSLADDPATLAGRNVFIIAAPTPVDDDNKPDMSALLAACRTVGAHLGKGGVVVSESTVYPGVTEDVCGPVIAAASGLKSGHDFFLGYSPERINPGDREHTVERIRKVVAGQTPDVATLLASLYGAITSGGVYVARNIRTAEAAKAIENAQRDINIAFINEVAQIARRLGLSIHDVLETAGTKWNFLPFQPGLVGGHCIGVDPYYLAHCAQALGHEPEIILAGRRINDGMADFIAGCVDEEIRREDGAKDARILLLGLTFKEDVPDLRSSKSVDLIHGLVKRGHKVDVHDPMADADEARRHYGVELLTGLERATGYDAIVGAVGHRSYRDFTAATFERLVRPSGLIADIKGIWGKTKLPAGRRRWQL